MGGRGASYGYSDAGKKYGTEYSAYGQSGSIKFVKYNDASNAKAPAETSPFSAAKGRIYAVLDDHYDIKYITFYDRDGILKKQVDVKGKSHSGFSTPHVHIGADHQESYFRPNMTSREKKVLEQAMNYWNIKRKRLGL